MQLLLLGQNVCEVNRERSCLSAASSVCDSTKHNGLVTPDSCAGQRPVILKTWTSSVLRSSLSVYILLHQTQPAKYSNHLNTEHPKLERFQSGFQATI